MMRKIFALLAAVAVLLTAYCVLAPEEVRAAYEPETRMTHDLLRYIYYSETMYSYVLWALDYIDKFDRERSWESLQLARASVVTAKSYIARLQLPELEMTAEDQRVFMKRGADLTHMADLSIMFKAEQNSLKNTCNNLKNSVMDEVLYTKDDWAIWMRYAANTRKLLELDIQYLANMADWVLASLNDPKLTEAFNSSLQELCPQTRARQRKKAETPKNIEASANELLNQIDKLITEYDKILGAKKNALNAMQYALEKKNAKWFTQNIVKISNLPPLVQKPKWLRNENADIHYYWKEGGKVILPSPGTKLERVPDSCRISINGVSLAQVQDYQKKLAENGLPCSGSKNEGGKYYALYNANGGEFAIIWENDTVIMHMDEKPVCFIPYLYLLARKNL